MSISCRQLYEAWSNGKGAGYGSGRLENMFINACNMALDDLSYDADLASNHSHIESIDDTISTLDSSFFHTLFAGIEYYGCLVGVRPADPKIATVVFQNAERLWDRLKGQYMRSIDNADQPTQSSSMEDIGFLDV
jgi:hypothetical protein